MAAFEFTGGGTATTGGGLVLSQDVFDYRSCGVTIKNTGSVALSGLSIKVLQHSSADEITIMSVAGDFTEPLKHPLMLASNNIFVLAINTAAALELWVWGYRTLRIYATTASGTTSIECKGILK